MKRIDLTQKDSKTETSIEEPQKIKNPSIAHYCIIVIKAIFVSFLSFGIAYYFVDSSFGYFRPVIAMTLTVLALISLKGVSVPYLERPVTCYLAILFIFSLMYEYKHDTSRAGERESVTLRSIGDIWFTNREFKEGSTVTVEVLYNKVRLFDGDTLYPGKKEIEITTPGKITFQGIENKPTEITVVYK